MRTSTGARIVVFGSARRGVRTPCSAGFGDGTPVGVRAGSRINAGSRNERHRLHLREDERPGKTRGLASLVHLKRQKSMRHHLIRLTAFRACATFA